MPASFKALLNPANPVLVPGVFNAISALLAQQAGAQAVYVSGAGMSNGVLGLPDVGAATLDEMATHVGHIARAVSVPVIADADTGFGEAVNVARTIERYQREGASGLHLEDQLLPKRCGHLGGKQLISTEAMVEKLQTADQHRTNPDFCLIARTDARSVEGLDHAIARAQAYAQAGADVIFAEALESLEEYQHFVQALSVPILANMTEFGKTPLLTMADFKHVGVSAVIYPMTAFRVMLQAVQGTYQHLLATGSQSVLLPSMMTRQDLYTLLQYTP
jgi:methylisocitrate lyase